MNAIMAIMEDEEKDAIMVQLYYQEKDFERRAEDILPEGAILIVKEPYLKLMADGDYGIRVDHISDVVRLTRYDERIPSCWKQKNVEAISPSALRIEGNNCFGERRYHAAIEL